MKPAPLERIKLREGFDAARWVNDVGVVLRRMADLLDDCGERDWATGLLRLRDNAALDPLQAAYEMRRLFGGAGSLIDIVLLRDGVPDVPACEAFEALRARLVALCFSDDRPPVA